MDKKKEIDQRLNLLEEKYSVMGQDMLSYLDGLLYADYLTYWDYIHLDTLLSLQNPKTKFPDEPVFIIYHQITELYFKLILNACDQIIKEEKTSLVNFKEQLQRIVRYFDTLTSSFDIMVDGMDKGQFLKFRMSLLPASGFQSAQYRKIELLSTDLNNLIHHTKRESLAGVEDTRELYRNLYWKRGATELATGKKTLTLKQFENKYSEEFIRLASKCKTANLWQSYKKLTKEEQADEELLTLMKQHDFNANVLWPLMHLKSAVRYLDRKPEQIAATGGTNWQKYLPPKNQRITFYPELWSEADLESWGRKIKI